METQITATPATREINLATSREQFISECIGHCAAHDDLIRIAETLSEFDASLGLSPTNLGTLIDWANKALAKAGAA